MLIPAHNEAEHIRAKMENTINLKYPRTKVRIVVCSDGSTDHTVKYVERYIGRGVEVLKNRRRQGKARTLNRLLDAAETELVLLTDASAMLGRETLRRLVRAIRDPQVGIAEARYQIRRTGEGGETEAGYWGIEARIRTAESERHMLLGASGAAYLVRKELVPVLPADTINDDYVVPLQARARGFGVVYVPAAVASDTPTEDSRTLYYRWVRIAFGNWQMLWRFRRLLVPWRPRIAMPLWRKMLRTAGPLLLVALATVVTTAAPLHRGFAALAAAGWAGFCLGVVGSFGARRNWSMPRIVRTASFATVAQVAYLHGFVRWFMGRREGIWRRAAPGAVDLSGPRLPPLRVRVVKRTLDVTSALFGLTVMSPIMLIVGLLIRFESPGPIIYRQERVRPDFDGTPVAFDMFKFRSMRTDAEAATGPVWATQGADARTTRVGRFIRKYRLDELPQFVNVLRGEMSLVGPRPERPFFVAQLEEKVPFYTDRITVLRPGITGWAQVQVGYDTSVASVHEKVAHDLAYLAHMYSLRAYLKMELTVLWRTVGVVLRGTGSA